MEATGTADAAEWARSMDGDGDAFGALFDRHKDRVFRHACRLVGNRHDAEDVTAVAFLELWRRRRDVRVVNGSVLPWLLVTTSNVARNSQRASRRYRQFLGRLPREPVAPDATDAALDLHPFDGIDQHLGAALRSLSGPDLQLVTLIALEDYSVADAAEVLRLTPSAAKTRLHRARHRLRAALGGLPDDVTTQTIAAGGEP